MKNYKQVKFDTDSNNTAQHLTSTSIVIVIYDGILLFKCLRTCHILWLYMLYYMVAQIKPTSCVMLLELLIQIK